LDETSPEEYLTRYIFSEKHFAKDNQRVKHAAFMPPDGEIKVSVFRILGLTETEVWNIGKTIEKERPSSLKARADILTLHVLEKNLKVESAEPPPRHANIILPNERSQQKLIAIELAAQAKLYVLISNKR
jgi:hypothetical protein